MSLLVAFLEFCQSCVNGANSVAPAVGVAGGAAAAAAAAGATASATSSAAAAAAAGAGAADGGVGGGEWGPLGDHPTTWTPNADGSHTVTTYDPSDGSDRAVTYDASSHVLSTTSHSGDGYTTTTTGDSFTISKGNVSTTYGDGTSTTTTSDGDGHVLATETHDANGDVHVVSPAASSDITHDADGNTIVSTHDADGSTRVETHYGDGTSDSVAKSVDADGNQVTTRSDGTTSVTTPDNVTTTRSPSGTTTTDTPNADGTHTVTRSTGDASSTSTTTDSDGHVLSTTVDRSTADGRSVETRYGDGGYRRDDFDAQGHPLDTVTHTGDSSSIVDNRGNATVTGPDADGHQVIKETTDVDAHGDHITTIHHDDGSRSQITIDSSGATTSTRFHSSDGSALITDRAGSTYTYDTNGHLTEISTPGPNGSSATEHVDANLGTVRTDFQDPPSHPSVMHVRDLATPASHSTALPSGPTDVRGLVPGQPMSILKPDGNLVTFHPDGTQLVHQPDGTWTHYGEQGPIAQGHQPVPDVRPPTTTVVHQTDGTAAVTHPDGTRELWANDRLLARFPPLHVRP